MKKYLLGLFVGFVGFISFCSALSTGYVFVGEYGYTNVSSSYTDYSVSLDPGDYKVIYPVDISRIQYRKSGTSPINFSVSGNVAFGTITFSNGIFRVSPISYDNIKVYKLDTLYTANECQSVLGLISSGSCPECQECPEVNTGEILSGYILESEIDINYCVGNGLCPNECGSGSDFSGDLQYSNIYINNILHPGKQNIFVDIPDYITWDYSMTGDDFNLYVGSGYDVDYINSVIDINSYRPDSKDFTDIFVGGLVLITPYIVAILFFILVWKLLKRIFS